MRIDLGCGPAAPAEWVAPDRRAAPGVSVRADLARKRSGDGLRLVVLSPHLDDGVLSTGARLARHPGALVVTAFAGRPPAGGELTPWDTRCGFGPGDDVMGRRREEDRAALHVLQAEPLWLGFLDRQYAPSPPVADLAAALREVMEQAGPATVLVPLGLFHSDHALLHEAALVLMEAGAGQEWIAYEDVPYRRLPGLVEERVGHLHALGLAPERLPCERGPAPARKRAAVACYRSQIRGLGTADRPGHGDAFAPEGYWRLAAGGACRP